LRVGTSLFREERETRGEKEALKKEESGADTKLRDGKPLKG